MGSTKPLGTSPRHRSRPVFDDKSSTALPDERTTLSEPQKRPTATYRFSVVLRIVFGALLGTAPVLISLPLSPAHRSPYLLAYPAVIVSAWLFGPAAAVACAVFAAVLIEHYIFGAGRLGLTQSSSLWFVRQFIFLLGSVLAGVATRFAAARREKQAGMIFERELRLAKAERDVAIERERANELARENDVRLSLALDGADVGLWAWDVAANVSRWTPGFYRLHGLPGGGPASHDIWISRVLPEDRQKVLASLADALGTGQRFSSEYRINDLEGAERWIACDGVCVLDDAGTVTQMSGYCVDITRRKRTEVALIRTEKLAVAGRLAASIAHEINDPLDAAINLLYLLRDRVHDAEGTTHLNEAVAQLERVSTISQQTLRFSRNSTRVSQHRPSKLIESTLNLLGPKLKLSGTTVKTEVRQDPQIYCSSSEIQQILTNLVNNAVDAMGQGGTLRLRVSETLDGKTGRSRQARITIADSGSGMTQDVLRHMREPFFTTKQELGTGLGMWVVYELIERYGGRMMVRTSTVGQHRGTAFSIALPLGCAPEMEGEPDGARI